jgi:hypothetical protein
VSARRAEPTLHPTRERARITYHTIVAIDTRRVGQISARRRVLCGMRGAHLPRTTCGMSGDAPVRLPGRPGRGGTILRPDDMRGTRWRRARRPLRRPSQGRGWVRRSDAPLWGDRSSAPSQASLRAHLPSRFRFSLPRPSALGRNVAILRGWTSAEEAAWPATIVWWILSGELSSTRDVAQRKGRQGDRERSTEIGVDEDEPRGELMRDRHSALDFDTVPTRPDRAAATRRERHSACFSAARELPG